MEDNLLTVRGERKLEHSSKEEGYLRTERFSGTFFRQFTLPDNVNSEEIKAVNKNGVLEILIPKVEQKTPKKIEVKICEA